ncbi:MAG: T9SS type A sorting domain-containing protein, partial [Thioalkalivibrio sp.]|nr:T9SS type A sorting domain-containing protein [Thioalkalivibrio sp.]
SMHFTTDATSEVPYSLTGWLNGSAGIEGQLSLSDGTGTLHYYHFEAGGDSIAFDLSGFLLPGRSYRLYAYLQASVNVDPLTEPSQTISGSYHAELTLPVVSHAPIAAGTSRSLQAWPNPFAGRSSISVQGEPFTGTIVVYDVRGRRVREFRMLPDTQVVWDGRDRDGRSLPPGVYFLRLAGAGGGEARKVTLLR